MQLLNKIRKILLIFIPLALFFSYHPVITLGDNEYMNFELSLSEIWLVIFFFINLSQIKKLSSFYGWKKILLAFLIPSYLSLTIFWSANHTRAILTCGIFWLITFAALNIIYLIKKDKNISNLLQKSLLVSAATISIFCILQCIFDLAGVSPSYTLMCDGCTYRSFGFPHPNGFAIEPQFMGNLLLAPALLCFYQLTLKPKNRLYKTPILISLLFIITTTLFLTLSRGAIYAFIIALAIQQILIVIKNKQKAQQLAKSAALVIVSFAIALSSQGVFAAVSKTNDNFYSGIAKSLHQLTLGKLDLRGNTSEVAPEPEIVSEETTPETSHFSGYVEESTDVRLNLNSLALRTWASSPRYLLVGTGLGSAGIAMNKFAPSEIGPKEIVQNEYVSLLLETGLLGVAIIILVVAFAIKKADKKVIGSPLFISIVFGFALTLLFFSGLPNAINLYLFPLIFVGSTKHDFVIAKKI